MFLGKEIKREKTGANTILWGKMGNGETQKTRKPFSFLSLRYYFFLSSLFSLFSKRPLDAGSSQARRPLPTASGVSVGSGHVERQRRLPPFATQPRGRDRRTRRRHSPPGQSGGDDRGPGRRPRLRDEQGPAVAVVLGSEGVEELLSELLPGQEGEALFCFFVFFFRRERRKREAGKR